MLVQEFLDGARTFADFHEAFLSRWTRLPPRALTPAAASASQIAVVIMKR
jgi:hypothetical protein